MLFGKHKQYVDVYICMCMCMIRRFSHAQKTETVERCRLAKFLAIVVFVVRTRSRR